MRLRAFGFLCLAGVLLCLAPAALASSHPSYQATRERRINLEGLPFHTRMVVRQVRAALYKTVLPTVRLRRVSFGEAIDVIRHSFSEHNAKNFGVSIVLAHRKGEPLPAVNIALHSTSVAEALDALCAHGNYIWCVDSMALVIAPAERHPFAPRR